MDATTRAAAVARLFETVHEGAFIGTVSASEQSDAGATLAANPHLKHIYRYPPQTGEADVRPFAPERFADGPARKSFLDRLAGQGRVTDHLLRMRRMDGSPVWVEVTAHAREADGTGMLHVEALVRDVSERRKVDDQSRDLHQQLLQADKMAALGQTISGVAHELNNPLATILSWAERLAERQLDASSHKGAEVILGEAERAARIVRNLLTFARKRQSTRAMVDVNDVARDTLGLRAHDLRVTHISVATQFAAELPAVFADAHQIQQVLLNLIINAEQAMRASSGAGALRLRTAHDAERESIVIEIQDNGPGVPPETRSRIFDPFFTTKGVGQGTGLGLTVAYAIVQEHGGKIELESPPEGGALFRVELPVSGIQAASTRPIPVAPSMEAARGASVLVVEDEQALAAAVIEALSDAGLAVTYAENGEQALARLKATRYDVVICDLKMPRVDGMSLYRSMKAMPAAFTPPIIFVTGDVAGTDVERFLEETGCRWLAKPFRLAELLRAVREMLGETLP